MHAFARGPHFAAPSCRLTCKLLELPYPMEGPAVRISEAEVSSDSHAPTVIKVVARTSTMLALGALATGALAIGAFAIGRLAIGRARIRRLQIDELVVRKLRVTETLDTPEPPSR
jgi:hypothetical protein